MKLPGNTLLPLARQWYEQGIIPIPLHHASKHPAVFWRAWSQQRPPWHIVARAFDTPFYRGLGLLMGGERGLTVLDFDSPLPYYQWRRRTGLDSYTIRTGRGYHVYFYLTEPPPTTLSMGGDAGEIKGNGYVVTAPSMHRNGRQYERVGSILEPLTLPNLHVLGVSIELPPIHVSTPLPPPTQPGDQPSLIAAIKQALPLTQFLSRHTQLEPSGDDFLLGVCPFHNDHQPSLWVNPRLQICGCFAPACPAHGKPWDVINAYGALTGLHNGAAIFDLAQQLGLV